MSNGEYHLNASFRAIGAFWPFGQPENKFTGTVSSEKGKVSLASAPVYSVQDVHSVVARFFRSVNSRQPFERTESLCGFTSEGECSLLSAALISEGGLTNVQSGQRISDNQYRIWAAVMGLHLESADAATIDSADLSFPDASEWFPSAFGVSFGNGQHAITTQATPLEVFRFHCAALDSTVTCRVHTRAPVKRRRAIITSLPIIVVQPVGPRSLLWFIDVAIRIENFLTLCLGTSVNLEAVRLLAGDEAGWLVRKTKRHVQRTNVQTWIRCPNGSIARGLDEWLSVTQDKRPVEKVVLGVLRKSSIFVETEFLILAQALEGFDRIQNGDRRKDFRRRIEDTYDMLTATFAQKLLGEKHHFSRKVVQTRNFFTHLGIPAGADVVQDGGDLFDLNQRLHALLRCVMLLRLGIEEAALREPIQYQASRWVLR